MKLKKLRLRNFQSFGDDTTTIDFAPMTFLLGPNGAGKTAVLQAVARLFAFDPSLRRVQQSDFHSEAEEIRSFEREPIELSIEADFVFPELKEADGKYATIPSHFAHMQLPSKTGVPRVRLRLDAKMDSDGEIEEMFNYVVESDASGEPTQKVPVPRQDRNAIQVHYLPARRDPTDHITYAANSLLGRALRSADWQHAREEVAKLTNEISEQLSGNEAIGSIGKELASFWTTLHKGAYYAEPRVSFERNDIDSLLRHLTVAFSPSHTDEPVDFSRLSDGQKSLLYISLVLAIQGIGRRTLAGKLEAFSISKLRPAIFTLVAMEEPENSLSPHYLGRVVKTLTSFAANHDTQAIVATHSPSLLKRVAPETIRHLRLDEERHTVVSKIILPESGTDAHKFVREAVQAFPELYFSRLVILGEGDSEEIVLPRLLKAYGLADDDASISVVPLGGRHVNHFWRLLTGLGIPHLTLLDLDLARHGGGWGRVRYASKQLLRFAAIANMPNEDDIEALPKWNGDTLLLTSPIGKKWLRFLESVGVFFSSPLDLDFAMLSQFPKAYEVKHDELEDVDDDTTAAVLGKSHGDVAQYSVEERSCFSRYYTRFKLGSKPAAHLTALARLDDKELRENAPASTTRLLTAATKRLSELPE